MSTGTTRAGLPVATGRVELEIGGMTCASCAARIEKKLNRLDGVSASVNFATEKAAVTYPATPGPADADRHGGADRLHGAAAPAGRLNTG